MRNAAGKYARLSSNTEREHLETSSGSRSKRYIPNNKLGMDLFVGDDTQSLGQSVASIQNYFQRKTGGSRIACLADFVPRELKSIVPYVIMADVSYGIDQRLSSIDVKVVGSNLTSNFRILTGRRLSELHGAGVASHIFYAARLSVLIRTPTAIKIRRFKASGVLKETQVLVLPLSDDQITINKILAVVRTELMGKTGTLLF